VRTLSVASAAENSHSSIWVGQGLVSRAAELLDLAQYSSVVVVSDRGARAATQQVADSLNLSADRILELPGGEVCKSVETLGRVWEFLIDSRLDRRSLVIAIGGGAITDLVGFAAATYMRGVSYVAIPTTLLAQVDASIGGKTGINLGGIKNVVGVIRQPIGVIIDTDTLGTLPERELRSGFAEIVKHGLIADRDYFDRVVSRPFTHWSGDELVEIVFRSCQIKRATVQADERESGERKSLNFGHTLGHAIEAIALKREMAITHGEAVAIGMHAATFLSCAMGTCPAADLERVVKGLITVGLPIRLSTSQNQGDLLQLIAVDKKNVGGESRWTLLTGLGACVWDRPVSEELVRQAIALIQPCS
jgi:3-dehydroquinate synthase